MDLHNNKVGNLTRYWRYRGSLLTSKYFLPVFANNAFPQPILIGGYDGSEVKDGVVETTQYINMEHSEKAENAGVSNQGSDVFHEAIESYYGGQNDPGGIYDEKKFEESHKKAHEADPSAPVVNRNLNTKTGQTGLINPSNGKSVDLRPMTNGEKEAAGVI